MFRDGCGNLHKGAFKNNRGFARERIEGKAMATQTNRS